MNKNIKNKRNTFLVLFLITILLSSCYIKQGNIIDGVKKYNNYSTLCLFTIKENDADFYAPCNTYVIGDTVKFCK